MSGLNSGGFCANSVLRLKNASGDLKGEIQIYDSSYDANYEFWDGLQPILLLPGDTLEVENGGEVRSWEIPTLTLAADLEADLIYGEGTPGEVLAIYVDPFWSQGGYYGSYTTTVSHAGLYSLGVGADFSLFPGDQVHVNQEGDNPRFFAHYGIPIIRAVINDWEVNGVLTPYTLYTLAIQTAGQVYVMPENISFSEGRFYNYLFTEDGQELPVQPGDTLVITTPDQVIEFPIPWMSAIVDPTEAEINGEAPPNASLRVYVNSDNGWGTKTITATPAGTYQVEFPDLGPLLNATGGVIYNNEDGNETELRFATRHLNITLGDNCVFGTVGTPGSVYTLTFQTSDGGVQEVISGISSYYGGDISVCLSRVIVAGDHIILADPADEITVDVPHLSAQYDPIAQVISGERHLRRQINF